jgi:iron complex outermembrane receptor protein
MSWTGFSQSKTIYIRGVIKDAITLRPLESARFKILESNQLVESNAEGKFQFTIEKEGEYHVIVSHLGCESEHYHIDFVSDTFLEFFLHHYHKHLKEVKIGGKATALSETVSSQTIDKKAKESLASVLEKTTGARSLRNGNIAKPIIQGLYGNRLTILHQGIAQSGQQWGNDHAPEIDPLAANKLKVINGVAALEYKGINMGAIILVEANKLTADPHMHGKLNVYGESNGRGFGLNMQLEKNQPHLAWRLTGTYKQNGDRYSPDYFLRNTGAKELNLSYYAEKTLFHNWKTSLYLSTFNTELGVLRGSHISNLTDLNQAIGREQPFFTEADFNGSIGAPRQMVNHHFVKLVTKKDLDSNQSLSLTYSGQLNNRKEFDVRRGSRSEIPALFIIQHSHFLEGKWSLVKNKTITKAGIQMTYSENINQPETGVTPLIPNYSSIEPSLFFTHTIYYKQSSLDFGFRSDLFIQNIYTTTRTIPRQNIEFSHLFGNIAAAISYSYQVSNLTQLVFNSGLTVRNPAINELYSFGLHQGVSSIEEGNANLKSEKSFKTSLAIQSRVKEAFSWQAQAYFHNLNDFIYLKPQSETRLTIRGAYPVFVYEQNHVQMYGLDISTRYKIAEGIDYSLEYNYLRGNNLKENLPLVFVPANRLRSELEYSKSKLGNWENPSISITGSHIFKQNHLNPAQDFMPAPDAYILLGTKISIEKQIQKKRLNLYLQVDNFLNTRYRDYLNRLRYFANEQGRNIVLGLVMNY